MPLIKGKSQKAFDKNVEAEMSSGKPQKQSLAIAFDVQRKSRAKKKLASGGRPEDDAQEPDSAEDQDEREPAPEPSPSPKEEGRRPASIDEDTLGKRIGYPGFKANGGGVGDDNTLGKRIGYPGFKDGGEVEEHYESIADAILAKRRRAKAMADGGIVENEMEEPAGEPLEQLNEEAVKKELYDELDTSLSGRAMRKRR